MISRVPGLGTVGRLFDRRCLILGMLAAAGSLLFGRRTVAAVASTSQIWVCTYRDCEPYHYDPARGDPDNVTGQAPIPPGTRFEDLPPGWICPVCGAEKSWFIRQA